MEEIRRGMGRAQEQMWKRSGRARKNPGNPGKTPNTRRVTTPVGFRRVALDPLLGPPRLFQPFSDTMCRMRDYPAENWKALGQWVHDARMQVSDWRDMKTWASLVGRSDRQLRGLERGEPVGVGTIEAVSRALGVEDWHLMNILTTGERPRVRDQRAPLEDPHAVSVAEATDQMLLDEIASRMRSAPAHAATPIRKDVRVDVNPAPITQAGSRPAVEQDQDETHRRIAGMKISQKDKDALHRLRDELGADARDVEEPPADEVGS